MPGIRLPPFAGSAIFVRAVAPGLWPGAHDCVRLRCCPGGLRSESDAYPLRFLFGGP